MAPEAQAPAQSALAFDVEEDDLLCDHADNGGERAEELRKLGFQREDRAGDGDLATEEPDSNGTVPFLGL